MAASKDLLIKLKSQYENQGLNDLKSALKQTQADMNAMRIAGQQNSQAFQDLKGKAGYLTTEIKGVGREFKGLDRDVKMSRLQLLEMGENITVLVAGLVHLGNELAVTAKQGAEYGVLKEKFIELSGGIEQAEQKLILLRQASSGNLDDKNLIQYGNKMKLLGFNSNETAQFLDIVERKSDEVGIAFETGKDALEAYILTGRGKGLKELGINIADVENAMIKMTGATSEQIKKLDEEEQQTIRTKLILTQYGDTIENITKKQKDNADKLSSVETALANLRLEYGRIISEGIVKFSDSLGMSNDATTTATTTIGLLGFALKDLLPILAVLKIAFPALFTAIISSASAVVLAVTAISTALGYAITELQTFIDLKNQEANTGFSISDGQNPVSKAKNDLFPWAKDYNKDGTGSWEAPTPNMKSGDRLMLDDDINKQQQIKKTEDENRKKEEARIEKKLKDLTNKNAGSSKQEKDAVAELIAELNLEVSLYELTNGLKGYSLQKALDELLANKDLVQTKQQEVALLNEEKKLREQIAKYSEKLQNKLSIDVRGLESLVSNINKLKTDAPKGNDATINDKYKRVGNKNDKENASPTLDEAQREAANVFVSSIGTALNGIISNLGLHGETAVAKIAQGFERVVGIVQTIQAVFAAIQAAQQAVSFLKTVFPFLADGGTVSAGQPYIVGDAPGGRLTPYSELFVPKTAGTIYSNSQLMNMLKGNSANNVLSEPKTTVVNKYFSLEQDGIRFLEKNLPAYVNKKNFRQL